MKKLILGISLLLGACATCPTTQVIETPVAIHAKNIQIPECPLLPILSVLPTDTFDVHLKAWDASILILRGCNKAKEDILKEINK